MENFEYADVSDRMKAAFTDLLVYAALMFLAANIFASMEDVSTTLRIVAFVFIFGLYDPLFTSLFGGTIGHYMYKLRVKRSKNPTKNIILPLAIVRFAAKTFLGIISLFTVHSNTESKAIHDLIVGSIVIKKGAKANN